jgi:hypothetical protein
MRIKTSLLLLAFFVCSISTVSAQNEINDVRKNEKDKKSETMSISGVIPTGDLMRSILNSMVRLIPYISNRTRFEDPANRESIIAELINISIAFEQAHKMKKFKAPGLAPSVDTMKAHLTHTIEAMNTEHKVFALTRVKATTQLCMTCHEQFPEGTKLDLGSAWKNVDPKEFVDTMDKADFYYLTRNWDEASQLYLKAIKNRIETHKNKKTWDENASDLYVFNGIKKLVLTHTLGHYDLDSLKKDLSQLAQEKMISGLTRDRLDEWTKDIPNIQASIPAAFELSNDEETKVFITKNMEPFLTEEEEMGSLELRALSGAGILKRYLFKNADTKLAPDILFWAARAERQIHRSLFFTFADIYLKDCITRYPKHPMAQRCYEEYESNIIFGHTGSAGTNIPMEELKELERLKKIMGKKSVRKGQSKATRGYPKP